MCVCVCVCVVCVCIGHCTGRELNRRRTLRGGGEGATDERRTEISENVWRIFMCVITCIYTLIYIYIYIFIYTQEQRNVCSSCRRYLRICETGNIVCVNIIIVNIMYIHHIYIYIYIITCRPITTCRPVCVCVITRRPW